MVDVCHFDPEHQPMQRQHAVNPASANLCIAHALDTPRRAEADAISEVLNLASEGQSDGAPVGSDGTATMRNRVVGRMKIIQRLKLISLGHEMLDRILPDPRTPRHKMLF